MKYLERIGLVGAVHTILIAIVPYFTIFFKGDPEDETFITQIILLTAIVAISLFTLLRSKRRITNIARVEGFAWGYFYNFLYELADLIEDKEANIRLNNNIIKTAEKDKRPDSDYTKEYKDEEIKIVIIIPNDLHSEYRLAKILSGIFNEVVVSPGKNSYYSLRQKFLKGYQIKQKDRQLLLLIDTPPTTMRAIKLYEESCCRIDHNDAFQQLDDKSKKQFRKICLLGKKKISPVFKRSLHTIITDLTQGSKKHTYKDLIEIITIKDLIKGIINRKEFENLELIGDNLGKESLLEQNRVSTIVSERKEDLLKRLEKLLLKKA